MIIFGSLRFAIPAAVLVIADVIQGHEDVLYLGSYHTLLYFTCINSLVLDLVPPLNFI